MIFLAVFLVCVAYIISNLIYKTGWRMLGVLTFVILYGMIVLVLSRV